MFKKIQNESTNDRIIRFVIGVVLGLFSYLSLTGILQLAGYVVAIILILTAITGFCLIYKLLGIKPNK